MEMVQVDMLHLMLYGMYVCMYIFEVLYTYVRTQGRYSMYALYVSNWAHQGEVQS